MFDTLIHGGQVFDGTGKPAFLADVGLVGDRIIAVGKLARAEANARVDATGLVVAPGMIDAHVHGDLILFHDPAHEPAVRQGVTTYIIGQDGVAMAPASPATLDHMRRYTAGFNGNFPTPGLSWRTVDEYLSLFAGRTAINAATLVPNGNIRMDVMGLEHRRATSDELMQMRRLVREGMEQGAVGLSSGLDYIPSLYADEAELTALCQEIAPFGGVYVTHMRGYAPHNVESSMLEVQNIGLNAGCKVHISHFNSRAEIVGPKLDGIGKLRSREYLLESMVFPNRAIASGFENVTLVLKNGAEHAGLVKGEDDKELRLESPEEGALRIAKADIVTRQRGLSAMPEGMEQLLSKREVRDLVEYLAGLK